MILDANYEFDSEYGVISFNVKYTAWNEAYSEEAGGLPTVRHNYYEIQSINDVYVNDTPLRELPDDVQASVEIEIDWYIEQNSGEFFREVGDE